MQSNSNLLGLHILLTLATENTFKLTSYEDFALFTNDLLVRYHLVKVGEASHIFDNGSFTSSICLMESHLCIHTWPEIKQLTADIYLCNYSQDNTQKVRDIAVALNEYFEASIVKQIEVAR